MESNLLYSVCECERSSHLKHTSQQRLDQRLTQSLATVALSRWHITGHHVPLQTGRNYEKTGSL